MAKKKVIRKVIEESVDKLDGARVRTCGPTGRSEDAIACRRRADDMIAGAQFGLAMAATLFDETVDASSKAVVTAVIAHVALALRADVSEDGGDDASGSAD